MLSSVLALVLCVGVVVVVVGEVVVIVGVDVGVRSFFFRFFSEHTERSGGGGVGRAG